MDLLPIRFETVALALTGLALLALVAFVARDELVQRRLARRLRDETGRVRHNGA